MREKRSWMPILGLLLPLLLSACVGEKTPPSYTAKPGELVVIGTLVRIAEDVPQCGGLHFGAAAEYGKLTVVSGQYPGQKLFVIHGCVELARPSYSPASGTVPRFTAGDRHRLVLTKENVNGIDIVRLGSIDPDGEPLYYCRWVERAE